MKSGNLNFLEPSGPLQACNGIALPVPFKYEKLVHLVGFIMSIYINLRLHNLYDVNEKHVLE
jgi:hypothetical protein